MIKKASALASIAAVAALAVAVAQASTTHHVHQTGEGTGIYHNFPPAPPRSTFAGTLGSSGAIVEKRTMSSFNSTTFAGTATVFGPRGSYSGTITQGTITPCSPTPCNGPPKRETAKVKVTAGHGQYKGATGSVTITDTYIKATPGFFSIVLSGTIKY
jgi:hypothetical protein